MAVAKLKAKTKTVNLLRGIFSKGLRLTPKTSVSQWADNFRMLPSTSAEPGRWHTDRAPYQRAIMDAFTEPGIFKVVVKSASQIGKSDIMNNVIGRFAHLDPCAIMLMQPTLMDAEDYSKSRIAAMIEATPVLRNVFKEVKSRSTGNTILTKYFPGGRLVITGANSPSQLASKAIRILLCDEVDRFPDSAGSEGDPVDLAAKRMTTFWNRVMGLFSTPTIKGVSRIDDEYLAGTQEEWQHECPCCGEYSLVTHRHIICDHEVSLDRKKEKQVIIHSVRWCCPKCGCISDEATVKKARQKFVMNNPKALETGVRSFHVNCFASPWIKWATVMEEWYKAEGDPEREKVVYNTRFGESYERKGNFESEEIFLNRREKYSAELPEGVLFLTAAVDTQDNRLEYEIAGWGPGEERWGITKGIILGIPDELETWDKLDAVLDKQYTFADGRSLNVARTFIDTGGHYSTEVKNYCFRKRHRRRYAIKGSSTPGQNVLASVSKIKLGGRATIPMQIIGTDSAKQYIMERLSITEPGAKYMHYPLDQQEDTGNPVLNNRGYNQTYFKGLISEELEPTKKNGQIVYRWVNIASDKRNEPLDLAVYNLACMQSCKPNWEKLLDELNQLTGKAEQDPEESSKPKPKPRKKYGLIGGPKG